MTTVAAKLMTAEEFYDWANRPENRHKYCELERGRIVEMSRPGKRHGLVCGNAAGILRNYAVARKKGYVCSNDTGVIVDRNPDTVRGPDVMFFEDADTLAEVEEHYGVQPPLLAVEVLSPNDTHGKLMRRVLEQLRFGTKLVWVLDPDARNVIIHRPGTQEEIKEETDELIGDGILPEFRCRVAEFFAAGQVTAQRDIVSREPVEANDSREELLRLDAHLGRGWAKVEIFLGLLAAGAGLFLGIGQLAKTSDLPDGLLVSAGLALVVFGGYLALAGHRSHLYCWNNRNTVLLIDEIRRLHAARETFHEHPGR